MVDVYPRATARLLVDKGAAQIGTPVDEYIAPGLVGYLQIRQHQVAIRQIVDRDVRVALGGKGRRHTGRHVDGAGCQADVTRRGPDIGYLDREVFLR